jgi:hypothetical protein
MASFYHEAVVLSLGNRAVRIKQEGHMRHAIIPNAEDRRRGRIQIVPLIHVPTYAESEYIV